MTIPENVPMCFGMSGTFFYLGKLLVINKHEIPITFQKYTFDPGLLMKLENQS